MEILRGLGNNYRLLWLKGQTLPISDTQYKYEDELMEEMEAGENYEKKKDWEQVPVPDEDPTGSVNGAGDEPHRMLDDPPVNS